MRAIKINEFGGPEVMKLVEIERPTPAPDEILVKVYASSVNPADYVIRQGGNNFLRPYLKLPLGLGIDAAGIVEETGTQVTSFKKGDKVYGMPNFLDGAYTEYLAAKASQFALKPVSISFNEAASIPSCGLMAWSGIADLGKVQPGQRVLVNGAAGGVGILAVQFAKAKGAYVIGTASARNFGFLKQLGVNEVIDYKNEKFEQLLHDIDVVFNASPVRDEAMRLKCATILKKGGIFICTQLDSPFSDEFKNALAEKHATGTFIAAHNGANLAEISRLIDEGKVKPVISKVYPLEKVAEAHRESETKHVRGKLILEIIKED